MQDWDLNWGRNEQNVGSQEGLGVIEVTKVFQEKVYKQKAVKSPQCRGQSPKSPISLWLLGVLPPEPRVVVPTY